MRSTDLYRIKLLLSFILLPLSSWAMHRSKPMVARQPMKWTLRLIGTFADIHTSDVGNAHTSRSRGALTTTAAPSSLGSSDVGECILLFGAFCNGNLGDVIQPIAMEHLLSSVAPKTCFWYAHPWHEEISHGHRIGEFFGGSTARLIHLTSDHAEQVNQFKALIIGGGGVFVAQHVPLNVEEFAEGLTLPIIVMGVGASHMAKKDSALLEKAQFVSGRDGTSTNAFSWLLQQNENPTVQPGEVALVRDPVLSDTSLTDTTGTCWKQSEGSHRPLCFVLPASNSETTTGMHQQLISHVVQPGDVFVNVFPKHQMEIEEHGYPGEVEEILDPQEFMKRLCSCRAIVSSRLHGAILGLHMGVPTFGAFHTPSDNKIPELMLGIMLVPEQFLLINEHLTREIVDLQVDAVRHLYADRGRRTTIHTRMRGFFDDFVSHADHVLFDIIGVPRPLGSEAETAELLTAKTKTTTSPAIPDVVSGVQDGFSGTAITSAQDPALGEVKRATAKIVTTDTLQKSLGSGDSAGTAGNPMSQTEPSAWRTSIAEAEISTVTKAGQPTTSQVVDPLFETKLVTSKASSPESDDTVAPPERVPSIAETLIRHKGALKTPPPTEGTVPHVHEAEETAVHTFPETELIPGGKSAPDPVNSITPTAGLVDITKALIVNDYVAAMLLLVSIFALAFLPPGGAPRRPSYDNPTGKEGSEGGQEQVQLDVAVRCGSTFELGISERSTVLLARSTSPGVAAMPSKMLFLLNFTAWVSLATSFSAYGKSYLRETRDPVGLLVLQGLMGVIVLCALGRFGVLDLHPGKDLTAEAARQAGLAAILHTIQALLTNFAVLVGGVAVTNALKAMEPVAAAAFSYLLLGKKCSGARVAGVVTIVAGIAVLTSDRRGGNRGGASGIGGHDSAILVSAAIAMAAVCCNALRNVVIKKGDPIPPHETLLACSAAAMMVGVVMMFLREMFSAMDELSALPVLSLPTPAKAVTPGEAARAGDGYGWLRTNGVNAALCFVGYNFASFNLLARLSPVGHAVGNSCKRMLVFASGLLFLGEVMSVRQLGGAAIALLGVLAYNIAGTR